MKTTIDAIVGSARKPCPSISEVRFYLGTNGKYYTVFGVPSGVTLTEEYRVEYAYFDGRTTFGTRSGTESELKSRWEAHQDSAMAEFRSFLETLDSEELGLQSAYWLKGAKS